MMRPWGVGLVVVLLVGLNVWRWWPTQPTAKTVAQAKSGGVNVENLRLTMNVLENNALPIVMRNIFEPYQSPEILEPPPPQSLPPPPPIVAAPPLPPEPPPKTPEELEAEAARAELAQMRLVGVIIHDATIRAYLTKGDQTYMTKVGDMASRFTVTAINANGVRLHDARTQVGGEIFVLGK